MELHFFAKLQLVAADLAIAEGSCEFRRPLPWELDRIADAIPTLMGVKMFQVSALSNAENLSNRVVLHAKEFVVTSNNQLVTEEGISH